MALQDVSFEVAESEFLCILGPSGCGKSTILNILSARARHRWRRDDPRPRSLCQFIDRLHLPKPRLLPWLTARENVKFAVDQLHLPQSDSEARIDESLELVSLSKFSSAYPHELSGGMQQRVAIARAFAVDPHTCSGQAVQQPRMNHRPRIAQTPRSYENSAERPYVRHSQQFEAALLSDRNRR